MKNKLVMLALLMSAGQMSAVVFKNVGSQRLGLETKDDQNKTMATFNLEAKGEKKASEAFTVVEIEVLGNETAELKDRLKKTEAQLAKAEHALTECREVISKYQGR